MAIEIIDVKYRDVFGINPKYWVSISKINDADSLEIFKFLINIALQSITDVNYSGFYRRNKQGYYCQGISTRSIYNLTDVRITGAQMMKFVRLGLMSAEKQPNQNNIYKFPNDFFTTNDLSIMFDTSTQKIIF